MARTRPRRALPQFRSKRLFVISTEGYRTEPIYFDFFNQADRKGDYTIKVLKHPTKTDPDEILNRLLEFRRRKKPGANTEYWMVFDKDNSTEMQLDQICAEARREKVQVALSNPCFERPTHPFEVSNRGVGPSNQGLETQCGYTGPEFGTRLALR